MYPIVDINARPLDCGAADGKPRVGISRGERTLDRQLPGARLNGQFQLDDDKVLLFVTDAVPKEDAVRVYLLSRELQLLDGLTFGAAFATGELSAIKIVDDRTVEFSFLHKRRYQVCVEQQPGMLRPMYLTAGVSRLGWRLNNRYLNFRFVSDAGLS